MTPSKQAKAAGLRNLKQVSEMTGRSVGTLHSYHKRFPNLFEIVLIGCKEVIGQITEDDFTGPEKLYCPRCLDKGRKR